VIGEGSVELTCRPTLMAVPPVANNAPVLLRSAAPGDCCFRAPCKFELILYIHSGMGTRRKSSRPRRSPPETETLASPAETRPRR